VRPPMSSSILAMARATAQRTVPGVLKDGTTSKGVIQTMLQIVEYLKARASVTEDGAAAVEYGLLVALIAAIIIGIVGTLGGQIHDAFASVSGKMGF